MILIAHGVAHLVGFVVPWRLMDSADVPYRTTVLGGSLDLGDTGIHLVGILWLALAAAFIWLAVMPATNRWSPTTALSVVLVSSALCVVAWPEAKLGLVVNGILPVVLRFFPR